ncbi:phosphatidylethanolamine-binding protein [Xylariomycetidae sp. FL0641]|nr:phosphatidylethanolamine-binding protein [Xylariomycetidae sp. FL0641]
MSLESHAEALRTSLATAHLVPGSASPLIPADFVPRTVLSVAFAGGGGGGKAAELGAFFRAGECKQAPAVTFSAEPDADADPGARYTFVLTDPDAPTPDDPKFAFWRHWVVSGLRPGDGTTSEANTLTAYLGPGPKDDSKPHRYLFLLYREPAGGVQATKEDLGGDEFVQRRSFKPQEFAERKGLVLVGVNWMTCAGDGWTE